MCSIVGSFSIKTLKQLIKANAYRGQYRHSVIAQNPYGEGFRAFMGEGAFTNFRELEREGAYYIAHHQAPTAASASYHPARFNGDYLFHNGIVKERHIEQMQTELVTDETWDTKLLCMTVNTFGFSALSKIDGSFAGVSRRDGKLYIFRNQLSPMFTNDLLDFSSTSTGTCSSDLPPEKVFQIDFKENRFTPVEDFKTNDNVYFFS